MQRILYTLLLSLAVLLQVEAQTPMRDWLASMPDSVMPLLVKNRRLDLIDFYDAKMEATVANLLEGKSHLEVLTDDFMQLSYTGTSAISMKLLHVNDTTDILCMVTTMKTQGSVAIHDSRIAFFDEAWNPLDATTYISEPRIEDFRLDVQSDSAQVAWGKLNIFFRAYQLSAESTMLKCVLTVPDYLSSDEREAVKPYVRQEPLTYRWINGRYVCDEQ